VLTCAGGVGVWFALRGPLGGRQRGGVLVPSELADALPAEVPVSA